MFDPEAIEVALFNLLKAGVQNFGFLDISRQARIWSEEAPANQPALFLVPGGWDSTLDPPGALSTPKYTFHYLVLVYARADGAPDAVIPPQTILNQAAKAILTAIRGLSPGQPQTLGGLVTNVWHEGAATMQPGILDEQCGLQIPLHAITGL